MDANEKQQLIEAIYKNYRRKEGKASGIAKLQKLLTTRSVGEEILSAVNNYNYVIDHRKLEAKYILLFSTFVNGRWQDYTDVSELIPQQTKLTFE